METKTFTAKSSFIEHVPGFGMVVGNVDEPVEVPVDKIEDFTDRGLIGKAGKAGKAAPASDASEGEAPAA